MLSCYLLQLCVGNEFYWNMIMDWNKNKLCFYFDWIPKLVIYKLCNDIIFLCSFSEPQTSHLLLLNFTKK